jgi:hypothetical protein
MKLSTTLLAVSLIASPVTYAKKTQSGRTEANTPEEQLAGFTVPEGFLLCFPYIRVHSRFSTAGSRFIYASRCS